MSHFRPYPGYRESGIDWVGPIPSHWSTKTIKRLVRSRVDRTNGFLEGTYIGLEDVQSGSGRYMPTENDSRRTEDSMVALFSKGDVLYGKLRPYLRKACIPDFKGAASTEFLILTPLKGTQSTWLLNWLLSPELTQQIEAGCEGAKMPRADWEHVGGLQLPVPPISEQQEMCSTLANETIRIDTLIEKKTRFIELLKEKRQALITHAVTKGLNPNAPMKASGIEWLGEVPAHWRTLRAKRIFRERDERSIAGDEELLTVSHITGVTPRSEKSVYMFEAESKEGYKICHVGDLVVNTLWAWMGAMGVSRQIGIASPSYNIYHPNHELSPSYLSWLVRMSSFVTEVKRHSKGIWSSRLRLYPEALFAIEFPVPPRQEQELISGFISDISGRIDELCQKTERSIELLRERRSALITAAVTGKIDLRDAA